MNSRLDTIQAAILLVKLEAFIQHEYEDVNKAAKYYTEKLQDFITTPLVLKNYTSSWAQYTIQLKSKEDRDGLQSFMKEKGIPTMVYYPKPMHKQQAFNDCINLLDSYEVTEKLCDTVLSLPIHPYITEEEQKIIVSCVRQYLG